MIYPLPKDKGNVSQQVSVGILLVGFMYNLLYLMIYMQQDQNSDPHDNSNSQTIPQLDVATSNSHESLLEIQSCQLNSSTN